MEDGPRGILKTGPQDPKTQGIKWDELTIAEHDKMRGRTMKIVEPKTPYEENDSDLMEVDQSEDGMEIHQHLTEAEANAQKNA